MSRTRLFEWHRRFKDEIEKVEDDHRSGRPSTSKTDENVERVRQTLRSDRSLTVRMIAHEVSMNSERVWRIITEDLGMRKICAKMVPRLLNEGQKERRVQVCQDILEQLETEPNLMQRVVTGDESWIFEYDPLTKRQSLEWKSALSPRPEKARVFKTKVMLNAFFDVRGIVLAEFLPQAGHGMYWNGRRFFHIPYWQFSSIPFPFHPKNLPLHIPFHTKIFFHIPFLTSLSM